MYMSMETKMKIQITKMNQKPIENYKQIIVSDDFINFLDISDNECSEVLANDVFDSFSIEKIPDCIQSLVKKLRMGGTMVVGGKEIRLFCKAILNGAMNPMDASSLVKSLQSMSTLDLIVPLIEHSGLQILSTQLNGIHYEIKAKRG